MTDETTPAPTATTPADSPAPPAPAQGSPEGSAAAASASPSSPVPLAAQAGAPPARAVKVVLTLRPHQRQGGPGQEAAAAEIGEPLYDVTLAVGADGCDPQFRTVNATQLAGALDEVPALVTEAEARWRSQPRYPRPVTPPRDQARASKGKTASSGSDQQARRGAQSESATAARPAPAAAAGAATGPSDSASRETVVTGNAGAGKPPKEAAPTQPAQTRQISLFG